MFTTLVSPKELHSILNQKNTIIVDCRHDLSDINYGRNAYKEAHLPNAIFAHLDDDLSGEIIAGVTGRHPLPPVAVFEQRLSNWGISNTSQVICYDDKGGAIASRLWWMLRWLGHEKVAVLDGGIQAWQKENYPLTTESPSLNKGIFLATPNTDLLVDADIVLKDLEKKEYLLIDSRAAVRYRGESEPVDPIAGHIPTAISAPFIENINTQKSFLAKEALQVRFQQLLGQQKTSDTIFYCGSGVTACHNLLALQYAGFGDAKLYPGSWSDWITDEDRPLEAV